MATASPRREVEPQPLGRRAANKADKLRRITNAARALFIRKGFDGTTMRDIAADAEVGFGTIFDYASNKRDLLFLICNPELEEVLDQVRGKAAQEPLYLDRMMALFAGYYRYYAAQPALARILLRELTFFSDGNEARKFLAHRDRFMSLVGLHINECIVAGQLKVAQPDLLARIVFGIYAWEVRRWLADDRPQSEHGIADLAALLEAQGAGFVQAES